MSRDIPIRPLDAEAFRAFGDVLECRGAPDRMINQGLCARFHDQARLTFSGGRAGLSLFQAEVRSLPLTLDMVERHPDGSQAFVSMTGAPFRVVVAPDEAGRPGPPLAFKTAPGQAVNYHA
ncbi:MAG: ureidoglycolate lyase, partial [Myxococcota bacterium]